MAITRKQFQELVQSEIEESGDWTRGRVLECDLSAMVKTANELEQPIHYLANTTNADYTVTIGNGGNISQLAKDIVEACK